MIPGFEIRRATPEDAPALALVNCIAFDKSNIMWKQLFKDVDQDDVIELVIGLIRKRMADGNVTFHVAVEKETNTIVGGGGLAVPMKKPDTQFKPKMPAKVNEKLAAHFFNNVLTSSKSQGYDPEKHCHRVGAFVLPEYQRKGLGSALTREGNAIADDAGAPTYVVTYDAAVRMFEGSGFVQLGHLDTDLEEFGGLPNVTSRTYALVRETPSS
ncbi:hypothetical protein NQ176_g3761 [Zarea fungicola]|uniref:Uncharacterized protein n=1 Tax=Zarea fungicola TaxID=93591 RepID=A0ACC1NGT8_9HYPO|nr:hypothetical protein NQ176_g3761 [Lecanicillium fungicola]